MTSFDKTSSILKGESDRGAVLIAAAMLELGLEKLLVAKLLPSTSSKDTLFDNNGALGTFSSKIEMSYRLGLITFKQKNMFNIFRRIRNEFAHSANAITLVEPSIRSKLNAAIEGHPAKKAFLEHLKEIAPMWGGQPENVHGSVSPRELFELIFGLEVEFLNIALIGVDRVKEKK
ncbi:hypothetical protein ABDZ57_04750 [Aeromonas veronii]|uniref:hypothetical protein n=1 Tax=Aeromonas veronii TaxID=654 RepID=UPI0031FC7CD9